MSKMKINKYSDKVWENEQGKLHREDGPAIEELNGTKYWFRNGNLHREDGPAIEYWNGYKEYWYCGERYFNIKNDTEWKRIIRLMALR